MRLGYFHRPHRGREVTPRRHPIPDPVQTVLQVLLELLDRAPVHSRRTLIGLDLLPGLPYFPLRNLKRLACRLQFAHATPSGQFPVDRTNKPRMTSPLGSARTASSRNFTATTSQAAGAPRI